MAVLGYTMSSIIPTPNEDSAVRLKRSVKSRPRGRSGVGHLIWTVIVSGLLLVPNCVIALQAVQWLRLFSEWFESPRMGQTLIFALPIAFLVVEWWIFDRVVDWLSPERTKTTTALNRR